jgi:protein ImuB
MNRHAHNEGATRDDAHARDGAALRDGVHAPSHAPVPAQQAPKVTSLRTVPRWQPFGAPAATATELWVGVHLSTGAEELERLATRAQRFSPRVSVVPPDGLLLEVKGSLHLFNGVEGLCSSLANECVALGMQPLLALSPTPLSALVAARCGKPFTVLGLTQLISQLSPLPLRALRWPPETLDRLAHMGVRTIGQVLRLPRAGFARRFGTEHLATLDRLTGRNPDLRERFRARERFRRKRDLTYEMESHEAILRALEPLLRELGKFLEARQCGIEQLECLLQHRQAPPTSCVLRLAAPAADAGRLGELLAERLNRLVLPEPVRSCELRSGELVRSVLSSNTLWQPGEHGGAVSVESSGLIERLRARLGPEAVYGLQTLPGHRPERAWRTIEPRGVGASTSKPAPSLAPLLTPWLTPWPAFSRPLWLLPAPRLLSQREGLPRRRGPLRLLGDPERIETGWWDGGNIERDYYVAVDIHGVRLWVFREREAPHRWFLQGVFG